MNHFSEEQTYQILNEIGIDVVSDTDTVWMAYCPFHGNSHSPAFAVNKFNGTFICFNDACGAYGDVVSLITQVTGKGIFAAHRVVARAKDASPMNFSEVLEKAMNDDTEIPEFRAKTLEAMEGHFWKSKDAQDYMAGRGFTKETLDYFHIGYSPKKNMVGVPMYDVHHRPIGLIGRSIIDKTFNNSKGLPKKQTLWNIHDAKRQAKVVITEASFDAMRVWQATGLGVVATLGSSLSTAHAAQLNKYFTHVVIMTDDDQRPTINKSCRKCRSIGHDICLGHNTGLELGKQIASATSGLSVSWAHLDSLKRYDGLKDAGDMTDDQIRYAVEHSISNVEMMRQHAA